MEIVVNNVVENEDGSCNVDIAYDNEALEHAKEWAKDKNEINIDDENDVMQAFVINMMEEHIKEKGDDMEEKDIDADK